MATHRQLIGSVTGPPGPQGDDGEQGTRWFYVTASASAAPVNARIGDIVVNGGAATYTIGTRSLAVGQFSYITSITPFTLQASPFGSIRGVQGATGPASTVPGPPGTDGFNAIVKYTFAVNYYYHYGYDSGLPLESWDSIALPGDMDLNRVIGIEIFGFDFGGGEFAVFVPLGGQYSSGDNRFARHRFSTGSNQIAFKSVILYNPDSRRDELFIVFTPYEADGSVIDEDGEIGIYYMNLVYWV